MTIAINEKSLAIWFVSLPDGDWMAHVGWEGDALVITYRFRYYEDNKAWESADRKSWYRVEIQSPPETADDAIAKMSQTARVLSAMAGGIKLDEIIRGSRTMREFVDDFRARDFVHGRDLHQK